MVVCHLLIGAETVTLQLLFGVGLVDAHEEVTPHLVGIHIPEEFFGTEKSSFAVEDDDAPAQFPDAVTMAKGSVGLHVPLNVESRIELLQKKPLRKRPFRTGRSVYVPVFGHNLVADDAGVGNKVGDAV